MKVYKALVAVALVMALAGCADLDNGDKVEDSGGTKDTAASSTTLTKDNFAEVIAAAQKRAKTSHVTMAVSGSGQEIKAEGDVVTGDTPAESAMTMTMDLRAAAGGQVTEMRLVEEVFYMRMGEMIDNKFAKIDLNDESDPLARQYGDMMNQIDPSKNMEMIRDAIRSFKEKGDAIDIDGVLAQPYELVVDTAKFGDIAGGGGTAGVPDEIVMTMFIGEDNLPRRVTTEFSGQTIRMDYSKWGESVKIEAPPASDITDKSPLDQMAPAA